MYTIDQINTRLIKLRQINDEQERNRRLLESVCSQESIRMVWFDGHMSARNFPIGHQLSEALKPVIIEFLKAREQELITEAEQLMK